MSKIFSEAEKEVIREVSGATAQEQALAKRYMSDSKFRTDIDEKDVANKTSVGPKCRSIFYGRTPNEDAVKVTTTGPSELELAAAIEKFPRAKCIELFRAPEGSTAPSSSSLSKEDYRVAKLAATFFGVFLQANDGPSVSFAYQTKRDRELKREAVKAKQADTPAPGLSNDGLPPGIQRDASGNLALIDASAFAQWKQSQEASAQAKKTIADALEQEQDAA